MHNFYPELPRAKCYVHRNVELEVHFHDRFPYYVCREGHHFSPEYYYARIHSVTIKEAAKQLSIRYDRRIENHLMDLHGRVFPIEPIDDNRFHESFSYWNTRNVAPDILRKFHVGALDFMPAIPFYDFEQKVIGHFIRYPMIPDNTHGLSNDQKCCHLPLDDNWQRKKLHCPPVKNWQNYVIIVEGILDVMKCFEAGYWAVAINGASITPCQIAELITLTDNLVIFTDDDFGGRSINLLDLTPYFNVKIASSIGDPNSMSVKDIQKEMKNVHF